MVRLEVVIPCDNPARARDVAVWLAAQLAKGDDLYWQERSDRIWEKREKLLGQLHDARFEMRIVEGDATLDLHLPLRAPEPTRAELIARKRLRRRGNRERHRERRARMARSDVPGSAGGPAGI